MTPAELVKKDAAAGSFLPDYPATMAFHAALVAKEEKGVVILGPAFAGKSTLATGLWMHGWTLLSDDVAFVDNTGSAQPDGRRVSLRNGSRDLVGDHTWHRVKSAPSTTETVEGLLFHPHELRETQRSESTRVAAFFFLARREVETAPARVARLNHAEAALALLPYAMNVRELPFPVAVRALAPLAESIASFDLGRGELRAMVEAVEKAVAG